MPPKKPPKNKPKNPSEEEFSERTVVTSIERVALPTDDRAYILFISGPLIGKMYLLEDEKTVVGRAADVDISISDSKISRTHLSITLRGGTFVNGERISTKALENGDKIHISSDTIFKFAIGDAAERMFQEEMHQMANYDAVTGILNKHAFAKRLKEEFSYSKRKKIDLSLLMIDIDFFKKVNDTHGHMAGDYVLHGVAQRIQKGLRDEDILARYGGEEFTVILRGTDKKGSIILAERIRVSVESAPFVFEEKRIPITISIGSSTISDDIGSDKKLIEVADAYLYKSKEGGRNRVTA
jgi:diguanylate cyclase (GGDEF)-like protein